MLGAKFVNMFKWEGLYFRGHIFCFNIAALCSRLSRGLPYTRKQTIVIYFISLQNNISFRHASSLVDCFDHILLAFHINIIYAVYFLTHISCTGIHETSRWSRYIAYKLSLQLLLEPIGVCVRATLSPALAEAALLPGFPLSTSLYKLKPGDLYLHLLHFSRQQSPRRCSVVKSKLRFPGHFGPKSLFF